MDTLIRTFLWVLHVSMTASIAALLVILILKLFNKHIGVRFQHALWIIVIIRLIVPLELQSNLSLFNLLHEKHQSISDIKNKSVIEDMAYVTSDFLREGKAYWDYKQKSQIASIGSSSEKISYKEEKATKENMSTHVLNIASCIWLVGVFSTTLLLLIVKWRFKRKILNLKELTDLKIVALLDECKEKININKDIPVYICDSFRSPCILGIFRPKVYIPQCVCSTNNYTQLYHILLHELIHYKRRDLIYNSLAIFAVMLHWFNPVIWFCIKRMKLYRECACDAYVLEIIGEEQAEEYGMTLINFSKLISNTNKASQLAIFFETKNQIKRRIKMIKNFKKGSYRMSAAAVACCIVASGIVLTNAVNAKGMKADNIAAVSSNKDSVKKQESKFIIDSTLKSYHDMKKVQEVLGFKFKVPDFLPESCTPTDSFHVVKVSDKDNALQMFFSSKESKKAGNSFEFYVSKVNMEEFLKQDAENRNKQMQDVEIPNTSKDNKAGKVEISKEAMNLAGINGSSITIKSTLPGNYNEICKFFVWQNEGMYYSIKYSQALGEGENLKKFVDISTDDVGKVATSIKYIEAVKNVNYSIEREVSTELATLMIYDKEDLNKAKELLGFNPKLPLTINDDIKINSSAVGISGDSDIENKKINYELNTFYSLKGGYLTFTQGKNLHDYESIKKNGYIEVNKKEIKVQPLKIGDKEVFKYEDSFESELNKQSKSEEYIWQESGFYCKVSMCGQATDPDEIAKGFVNSKSID
ncbi:M56 family metallopeptidase [Clostridium sp. OS1-26]|uniref:M56 family metallopeptidase n=1 Tax=Clostridium sp. OS1-26 TaxID=3070681 RepID=UPI0027E20070|nr:M56 family metallopeptidase [Clostridium sp. OS1-26]WML33145.1 M56 family metallopeptidase [Clostridium sp. OS1-26]